MERLEDVSTTDVCSTLFWHLSDQGLEPNQVNQLIKDVFNILREGGVFTVGYINSELSRIGWPEQPVDEFILELILVILEKEFQYSISSHTVH